MERVTKMFKYLESWSENGDEAAYVHYMDGLYDLSDVLVSAINVNLHSYFDKNGSQKRAAKIQAGADVRGVSDRQDTRICSNYPRPGE